MPKRRKAPLDQMDPVKEQLLKGTVERVTFHNEENGFTVLKLSTSTQKDLVAVVGHTSSVAAGATLNCTGTWTIDKKHGKQFKASRIELSHPTSIEGIEKYLSSGMIRGVGPFFAKKLIQKFGKDVLDILEHTPEKIRTLEGIGEKRFNQIVTAWQEQKAIREIMIFLQSHGIGTARAVRIFKTYGQEAIKRVQENPYRLALDIKGIGFKTADALATRLGIEPHSVIRAEAGICHALHMLCEHGHTAATQELLIEQSGVLLDIPESILQEALIQQINAGYLVREIIHDVSCIFPVSLYQAEVGASKHLERLLKERPPWGTVSAKEIQSMQKQGSDLHLSPSQQTALQIVLCNKISIITGGPGVGKTTLMKTVLRILQAKNMTIALVAPTGRAAKRLSETTGFPAKTIHRLLEFDSKRFSFRHDQQNPLKVDVLVIDETSMLDITLCYHLLKAIPSKTAVLFVGDVDQLPSVGSGAVLQDMIRSNVIATAHLTEIFRQAAHSKIITNAHRINQGTMPLANEKTDSDFYTIYLDTPEAIQNQVIELVSKRLPAYYRCNPNQDIQVLTPMNRGELGTTTLNHLLQQALNPNVKNSVVRFGTHYATGDKVIQTVNNYDKDVYNGDIGTIAHIDFEEGTLNILFDDRSIPYDFNELDELSLAYAITIHKSQGSEFNIVVIPISTQHFTLLEKNLLYTAVTRGKKLVVLVAQKKAIGMTVNNKKNKERFTHLAGRLKQTNTFSNQPPSYA